MRQRAPMARQTHLYGVVQPVRSPIYAARSSVARRLRAGRCAETVGVASLYSSRHCMPIPVRATKAKKTPSPNAFLARRLGLTGWMNLSRTPGRRARPIRRSKMRCSKVRRSSTHYSLLVGWRMHCQTAATGYPLGLSIDAPIQREKLPRTLKRRYQRK